MTAITTTCTFDKVYDAVGFSKYYTLIIQTPATADATNTIVFSLLKYGTVVGGTAFDVTGGVVETLGIALSGDNWTITVGTGDNLIRAYVLTMLRPDADEK
jgi:hypothetical protein